MPCQCTESGAGTAETQPNGSPRFAKESSNMKERLPSNTLLVLKYSLYSIFIFRFRLGLWRQAFDTDAYKKGFQPPQELVWPRALPANNDIVVDRACSKSYVAVLSEEEKEKVKHDLRAIIERGEEKVWINESEGTFEYPYKTYAVIAHKK